MYNMVKTSVSNIKDCSCRYRYGSFDRRQFWTFGWLYAFKVQIYDFDVYGTIVEPVHALNLKETMDKIDTSNTLVIAVDASIGSIEHIGYIGLCNEPIKPGSGVGKDLPPVGDISVSGIVAFGGFALICASEYKPWAGL